jgi:hypothetical protein
MPGPVEGADDFMRLLWAQQQNLFAAHGLAIDLVNTGSSAASLTALVATVNIIAKFTGQDTSQVRNSVRATSAVAVTLPELQRPLDFAYKYKLIERPLDAGTMLAPGFPIGARDIR